MGERAAEYSAIEPMFIAHRLIAAIVEHREVAPFHHKMQLRVGAMAAAAQAGQFVHILPRAVTTCDPLLRRAFSIMSVGIDTIDILYRIMGVGTSWLSTLRAGDEVDLIGPLGRPFTLPPNDAILVGGGVGVPPLVMLASACKAISKSTAIVGARSRNDLIGLTEFEELGVTVEVSTDDGSFGHHGRVTDLLEDKLESLSTTRNSGTGPTVYTCGPFAMLRAVAGLCRRYDVPCQVSLEENMPCGIGICNGCVVPVVGAGDDYGRYRRICVEGPVTWAHEIDWDHLSAGATCY